MNKKGVITGVLLDIVTLGVTVSYSSSPSETVNLDMRRTHGDVSTVMDPPILANLSAPITLIEFVDYQYTVFYNWHHPQKIAIYENYIATGKDNLIFVDLAFLGRNSPIVTQASYCAEDHGMYWDYPDLLYNSQESKIDNDWANSESLKNFAFSLGLDMDLFESCLDSGKYLKRVPYNVSEAKKKWCDVYSNIFPC